MCERNTYSLWASQYQPCLGFFNHLTYPWSISHIFQSQLGLVKIWFMVALQFQQPFISQTIVSHEWNIMKHQYLSLLAKICFQKCVTYNILSNSTKSILTWGQTLNALLYRVSEKKKHNANIVQNVPSTFECLLETISQALMFPVRK